MKYWSNGLVSWWDLWDVRGKLASMDLRRSEDDEGVPMRLLEESATKQGRILEKTNEGHSNIII